MSPAALSGFKRGYVLNVKRKDVIQFTNDDRITCEIVKLQTGVGRVRFDLNTSLKLRVAKDLY
jgi:hypothetical protein